MTIQQIQYLIEIERSGSFSKAAKKLFVSQPVLSVAMKKLEQELGFDLFIRTPQGVVMSERGYAVMDYANTLLKSYQKILTIPSRGFKREVVILTSDHSQVMECFREWIIEEIEEGPGKFAIKTCEIAYMIEELRHFRADIGIAFFAKNDISGLHASLIRNDLQERVLGTRALCIHMRKDHPAAKSVQNNLSILLKYPYVHYIEDLHMIYSGYGINFIDLDNAVYIDDRETRYSMIDQTNCYSIAMRKSPEFYESRGWIAVDLPDVYADILLITNSKRRLDPKVESFVNRLEIQLGTEAKWTPRHKKS